MVNTNISYVMNLQFCGPKSECLTKSQNYGLQPNRQFSLGDPKIDFEVDSESETTSKYILDNSGVFRTHFSYIKLLFQRNIGQNQPKSRKLDKNRIKTPVWGPLPGSFALHYGIESSISWQSISLSGVAPGPFYRDVMPCIMQLDIWLHKIVSELYNWAPQRDRSEGFGRFLEFLQKTPDVLILANKLNFGLSEIVAGAF